MEDKVLIDISSVTSIWQTRSDTMLNEMPKADLISYIRELESMRNAAASLLAHKAGTEGFEAVRYACWEEYITKSGQKKYRCSNCKEFRLSGDDYNNHRSIIERCPHCGVYMKEAQ